MNEEPDNASESVYSFLKRQRDELKLQMHLGGKDARDEWEKLEATWADLEERAEPLSGAVKEAAAATGEQAKKVTGAAMDLAAREISAGYEKLRKLLG